MPSAKVLEEKKVKVAALKERIDAAVAGVVVDYKGITVEDDTKLRKELREAGVHYSVAKNTLIRLAIDGTALAAMDDQLNGTTAIATSSEDYVAAARILSKFAEKHDNFKVKTGFIEALVDKKNEGADEAPAEEAAPAEAPAEEAAAAPAEEAAAE